MADEPRGFREYPRILSLSDLVFGLALTIGAMTMASQQATSISHLLIFIAEYAFSFIILIGVWMAYSQLMSVISIERPGLFNANIFLLFLVAIEPFLYNTLFSVQNNGMIESVSILYALDITGMFLILAFFSHRILNKGYVSDISDRWRFKFRRDTFLAISAIFLVSCLPFFWSWKLPLAITEDGFSIDIFIRFRFILWLVFSPLMAYIFLQWGEKYLQKHGYF